MKNATHWKVTRLTSIPLSLLFIYFVTQAEHITNTDLGGFTEWVRQPVTTGALALFVLCGFWHAQLGMEEVIIDYVPSPAAQKATLLASKLFFFLLGAASLYAVLALSFGK